MATYKQKLPRIHHIEPDSEESEKEWVPIERRLVNNVSDDEDWHFLNNTSPVEEVIPAFSSNSEIVSGGSDYDSEHFYVQDETARSTELLPEGQDTYPFVRKMPSHDGTGNFFDDTFSDGSNNDSLTSPIDSNFAQHASSSDQDNDDLKGSSISDKTSQDSRRANTPISVGKNSRESWITKLTKLRNVFRIEEDISAINLQEQTQQIYHKFAESASSAANFELGDLGNTNPIKVLANVGSENTNSTTSVTTQYVDSLPSQPSQTNHLEKLPASMTRLFDSPSSAPSSSVDGHTEKHASIITRLIMRNNPMAVNFAPTISKDMLNVNSADCQKQQSTSQISSQSDKNSLLSTVWTIFCRITNNIIVSDDTDPVPNDFSNPTNLTSNHNAHTTGLASIVTGENHYDYLPFGNILTLSELCPSLHNYKSHCSSSSTPSTSSYNKRRNSITSPNTARIFLTPASSSTSLKSFTSRAGSDCGLESSRSMGRGTTLEVPLVL